MEEAELSRVQPPKQWAGRYCWQCSACGATQNAIESKPLPDNYKCASCGSPVLRRVDLSFGPENSDLDVVDPDAVKHLKKRVVKCFQYLSDPHTKIKSYHKLQLTRSVFLRRGRVSYVRIQQRCATCGLLYGQQAIPLTRPELLERDLTPAELKQLKLDKGWFEKAFEWQREQAAKEARGFPMPSTNVT